VFKHFLPTKNITKKIIVFYNISLISFVALHPFVIDLLTNFENNIICGLLCSPSSYCFDLNSSILSFGFGMLYFNDHLQSRYFFTKVRKLLSKHEYNKNIAETRKKVEYLQLSCLTVSV
jgi:hypothetical protein